MKREMVPGLIGLIVVVVMQAVVIWRLNAQVQDYRALTVKCIGSLEQLGRP